MKPKVKHDRIIRIVALAVFVTATWMTEASAAPELTYGGKVDSIERSLVESVRRGEVAADEIITLAARAVAKTDDALTEKLSETSRTTPMALRSNPFWSRKALLEAAWSMERLTELARVLDRPAAAKCFQEQKKALLSSFEASLTNVDYTPSPPDFAKCGHRANPDGVPELRIGQNGVPEVGGAQSDWPEWVRLTISFGVMIHTASVRVGSEIYGEHYAEQVNDLLSSRGNLPRQ